MRVLLVETNLAYAEKFEKKMFSMGHVVETVDTPSEGISVARHNGGHDIIILDTDGHGVTGESFVKNLRGSGDKTPVIVLSSKPNTKESVLAINAGADDYLVRPFTDEEIDARIKRIVLRGRGQSSNVLFTGGLKMNLDRKSVTFLGKNVRLSGKEYKLLEVLLTRKGNTITRQALFDSMYLIDAPEIKIIDIFIFKIKKKIKETGFSGKLIETVRGIGYRIVDDPEIKLDTLPNFQEKDSDESKKPAEVFLEPYSLSDQASKILNDALTLANQLFLKKHYIAAEPPKPKKFKTLELTESGLGEVCEGVEVSLKAQEFRILELLISQSKTPQSRKQIHAYVYEDSSYKPGLSAIDPFIESLQKRLDETNQGYVLKEQNGHFSLVTRPASNGHASNMGLAGGERVSLPSAAP